MIVDADHLTQTSDTDQRHGLKTQTSDAEVGVGVKSQSRSQKSESESKVRVRVKSQSPYKKARFERVAPFLNLELRPLAISL